MHKLGLGTVQFGQAYGISNAHGQVSLEEADQILKHAASAHITWLDTAANYGQAEERLSQLDLSPFHIVTKTIGLKENIEPVLERVKQSVRGLGHVDRLLVHTAADLLTPLGEDLWAALLRLKEEGLVGGIGISVYASDEPLTLAKRFRPHIMQVPLSLLDQRLVENGTLQGLKELGIEIHARSIFLQGLLFLEELPEKLQHARAELNWRRTRLQEAGVTALRAALGYVFSRPEIDVAIVGVTSLLELEEILEACAMASPPLDWEEFALKDELVLTPSLW